MLYNVVNIIIHQPRPTGVLTTALVVAAGISGIDVGAHWPSDVGGGLLVGPAWIYMSLSLGRLAKPIFESRRTGAK
ncbi:MAG TPA: hypothetical protein VMU65_02190 [Candidatus Saccharimonadales bacterium]|nr:hypothetical protein [Candidatus Saccharimonadales bacterium]